MDKKLLYYWPTDATLDSVYSLRFVDYKKRLIAVKKTLEDATRRRLRA